MAAKKKTPSKKKPASSKKKTTKKPLKSAAKKAPARKPAAKKSRASKASTRRTTKRPALKRKVAPKKAASKPSKPALPEAPQALALAKSIAGVAVEKKAEDVVIIDVRARSSAVGYDYVVLASGESDRQLSAIHEGVDALLKPQGKRAASVEASPDWVCVNYDEGVVAHFFTPDKRSTMDLEGMWDDAPRIAS